ncbi:hypothetical protein Tco_1422023, partial [Tanacetum coccineum]
LEAVVAAISILSSNSLWTASSPTFVRGTTKLRNLPSNNASRDKNLKQLQLWCPCHLNSINICLAVVIFCLAVLTEVEQHYLSSKGEAFNIRIFNNADSTVIVNINDSVHEIVPIIQQLVLNPELQDSRILMVDTNREEDVGVIREVAAGNTNEPNHVKPATKVGDDHLGITSLDKEGEVNMMNRFPGTPNIDLHDATITVDKILTRFGELHLVLTMNPSRVIGIDVENYELLLLGFSSCLKF